VRRKGLNIIKSFSGAGDYTSIEETAEIVNFIQDGFKSGNWRSVRIIYTNFLSALKQEVMVRKILPFHTHTFKEIIREIIPQKGRYANIPNTISDKETANSDYIFEPDTKEIIQTACFWIDAFLQRTYKDKLETRYIIHDTQAWEISKEKFYRVSTNGGTQISSALNLVRKIIKREYNPNEYNIYCCCFGDGENISIDDNSVCINIIRDLTARLNINQFSYCEINDVRNKYDTLFIIIQKYKSLLLKSVRSIQIRDKDEIIDVINEFFH